MNSAEAGPNRLVSIDALRGFIMLIMLVDHVRETIFLHMQVSDPVDAYRTSAALFFTRFTSTICAPTFIFLCGVSASFFQQYHTFRETRVFLLKRGLFLIFLEVFVINTAWSQTWPPKMIYLQVIWCIGLCMIALAMCLTIPKRVLCVMGIIIIAMHNMLDFVSFSELALPKVIWSILHDRSVFEVLPFLSIKTSYPVLPWIGVILLGYTSAHLFQTRDATVKRVHPLMIAGVTMLVLFLALRLLNGYGDYPWKTHETLLQNSMAFLSSTKYPPSLLFLLFTLGVSALIYVLIEKKASTLFIQRVAVFGSAPMFFYISHLYLLKVVYLFLVNIFGKNKGMYYGVDHVFFVWIMAILLVVPLFYITIKFANLKRRRRDITWLKYL
jgi:uncharacterized membrane protein